MQPSLDKHTRTRGHGAMMRPALTALLLLLTGGGQASDQLLRGEVLFAVNCGRCHLNATGRFDTPPDEMAWLFWPTSPVVAHREVISAQDLQAVLDYLEDFQSRTR